MGDAAAVVWSDQPDALRRFLSGHGLNLPGLDSIQSGSWVSRLSTAGAAGSGESWLRVENRDALMRGQFRLNLVAERLAGEVREVGGDGAVQWMAEWVELLQKRGETVLEWSLSLRAGMGDDDGGGVESWEEVWGISGEGPVGSGLRSPEVAWPGGRLEDGWFMAAGTWDWQELKPALLREMHRDAQASLLDAFALIDLVFEAGGLQVERDFLQELGPWMMVEADWPAGDWAPGVVVVCAHRGSPTARAWILQILRYATFARPDLLRARVLDEGNDGWLRSWEVRGVWWPRELWFYADEQVWVLASDRGVLERWRRGSGQEFQSGKVNERAHGVVVFDPRVPVDRAWPALRWAWQQAQTEGWFKGWQLPEREWILDRGGPWTVWWGGDASGWAGGGTGSLPGVWSGWLMLWDRHSEPIRRGEGSPNP